MAGDAAEVRGPESPRTAQPRSAARVGAAKRAAKILREALCGRPTATAPAVAVKLGIGDTRALHLIRGDANWYVGDLLLLAKPDFDAAIAALQAARTEDAVQMSIERRMRRTSIRVGELHHSFEEAVADGIFTEAERCDVNRRALAVATEALAIVGARQ